jgi:hypothetical protein
MNIEALLKFKDGWHYGEGKAITEKAVERGKVISNSLSGSKECFPLITGGILLCHYFPDFLAVGYEIGPEGNVVRVEIDD